MLGKRLERSRKHHSDSHGRPNVIRKDYIGELVREQWPYLCGALALPIIALFIFAATLVTPGYSHVNDTISQLGAQGRPRPWVANTGIFLYGVLVLAFAYGLSLHIGKSVGGRALSALLAINAMAAMFAAMFQAAWGEAELEPSVLGDSVHQLAARVGFMALTTTMLLLPAVVRRRSEWQGILWMLTAVAILALVAGLLFLLNVFPGYSGVVQRCFFAMCGIWLELVALQILRSR